MQTKQVGLCGRDCGLLNFPRELGREMAQETGRPGWPGIGAWALATLAYLLSCFPCSLSFHSIVIHASIHGPSQSGSSLYPLPASHSVSNSLSAEMVLPGLAIPAGCWDSEVDLAALGLRASPALSPLFPSPTLFHSSSLLYPPLSFALPALID